MGVARNPGTLGWDDRNTSPVMPNLHQVGRDVTEGRPSIYGGSGSDIGKSRRKQWESQFPNPMFNQSLHTPSTTPTISQPLDAMYANLGIYDEKTKQNTPMFPGATSSFIDRSNRESRRAGYRGGVPGIGVGGFGGGGGGGGGMGQIKTPGGAEFYGNEMIDVMFDDFRVKKQMDPVMADLFKTQMDYEVAELKFGSDERVNAANIKAAMERAELEASLTRERNALESEWQKEGNALKKYQIEQEMNRLEVQVAAQREQQTKQHAAEMDQLTLRETGETERAMIPIEAAERRRAEFMPLLMSLLGGGGGGRGWGGGMPSEVGPNRDPNIPSFEGVLRRGVNDIVGNNIANRDAAMLGATASQTGPEGGLGGATTSNYLGPLAQHSAASATTGGINELLQNLLQNNLGQRQATAQTLGALSPYLT